MDWLAVAVAWSADRAACAVDQPLAKWFAVAGVVVRPLAERTVGEGDQAEDGVLAGRLDRLGHVGGPSGVEAAWTLGVAPDTPPFEQTYLAEGAGRLAKVVLQDVGIVDARVQRDGARELHVPPGRDQDAVAPAE